MTVEFSSLAAQFRFQGGFQGAVPYGTGHIHDTFLVRTAGAGRVEHGYIMQRINQAVFTDPDGLMENIRRVTEHLRAKIAARGGDPNREALTLIPTQQGASFLRTSEGEAWRSYGLVEAARTYDEPQNRAQVRSAGRAYGGFLRDMEGFPPESLHLTIPDFHHTGERYTAFQAAVGRDVLGRAWLVREEIAFVEARADLTGRLVAWLAHGNLPVRATHNDTKLNNVLMDQVTGAGVCVVDLDTVMPGTALYDYGDAIRTIAVTAAEDERDLSLVNLHPDYFEDFTRGYLEAAGPLLTLNEVDQFPFAAVVMTLECGIRFLTDYLNGDSYFKIQREHHNLDRSRTQFKLVNEMEARYDLMARLVARYR